MPVKIEEKVSELERIMKELAYAHLQTERSISELSKDFHGFQNEMKDFKDEMQAFKEEMKRDRKEMNKKWGDLANKMGTVAEDIFAPNIPRIMKDYFKCELLEDFAVRRRVVNKKNPEKIREFDCLAVGSKILLVNETKSTPKVEYIREFIESLEEIYDYFPGYRDKKIIPVFSSFYLPEDIVNYLTNNKIYALGMKDDTMEILNPGLKVET